jgi:long-chain acyl-CoA synthetase
MNTPPSILFEAAKARPDHVRFIVGSEEGEAVTLERLASEVASCAAYLRDLGVGAGDRVAIFGPNSVAWIVVALATQACGAAFVSIHAGSSAEIVRTCVVHSGAKLLFADPMEIVRCGVSGLDVQILPIEYARADVDANAPRRDDSVLEKPACIIYTSGTTGRPKGVVLTHANLAANADDWMTVCGPLVPPSAREVMWLPLSHAFGWGDACIGTLMGFTSLVAAPQDVATSLATFRPHLLMTVPFLLEKLARAAPDEKALRAAFGGELRLGLCGGATLAVAVKKRLRDAGLCVLEGYGLTETSPTLTLERPGEEATGSVGRAYPSVQLRIAEDGEVLAKGPNVFGGYFRDERATADAFDSDGWFKTGDLGRLGPSGHLEIVDRKKSLIVLSTGKKIAPQPIEARAAEDPWIERLVLFGDGMPFLVGLVVPDVEVVSTQLGRPVAFPDVAADGEVRAEIERRLGELGATLSTFETVKKVVVSPRPLTVENGALTASLKVKREAVWNGIVRAEVSL